MQCNAMRWNLLANITTNSLVVLWVLAVPVLPLNQGFLCLQVVHEILGGQGRREVPSLHLYLGHRVVLMLQLRPTQR